MNALKTPATRHATGPETRGTSDAKSPFGNAHRRLETSLLQTGNYKRMVGLRQERARGAGTGPAEGRGQTPVDENDLFFNGLRPRKEHAQVTAMMRHTALIAWLILGIASPALPAPPGDPAGHRSGLATVSTPGGVTLYCEIADTPASRSIGLMHRTRMAPDRGMLFLFPEPGRWTFWMKNTKMPLDILWLDGNGTIVHRADRVPVCERTDNLCPRYRPATAATQVLELRAGQAEALNLDTGARLTISMPKQSRSR